MSPSPGRKARIAGVFYLLNIFTGAFAALGGGRVVVNLIATIPQE